jgi:hypothetical protein
LKETTLWDSGHSFDFGNSLFVRAGGAEVNEKDPKRFIELEDEHIHRLVLFRCVRSDETVLIVSKRFGPMN